MPPHVLPYTSTVTYTKSCTDECYTDYGGTPAKSGKATKATAKDDKKKGEGKESYATYIYRVLKQAYPKCLTGRDAKPGLPSREGGEEIEETGPVSKTGSAHPAHRAVNSST